MIGGDIMFLFMFLVSHCATLAIDLYFLRLFMILTRAYLFVFCNRARHLLK